MCKIIKAYHIKAHIKPTQICTSTYCELSMLDISSTFKVKATCMMFIPCSIWQMAVMLLYISLPHGSIQSVGLSLSQVFFAAFSLQKATICLRFYVFLYIDLVGSSRVFLLISAGQSCFYSSVRCIVFFNPNGNKIFLGLLWAMCNVMCNMYCFCICDICMWYA